MTKKRMLESNDNFVTAEIKRREAKDGKRIREELKSEDTFDFTYMSISKEKDLEVENNSKRDNEMLREIQGFEKDSNGVLKLQVEEYTIDRDDNGKIVRIKDNKIIRMNRNVVPMREEEQEENEIA